MTIDERRQESVHRLERTAFPSGFVWGAATAAYQIEGAADEDGRGRSIWDVFSERPGAVAGGDTGRVAVDHYHRYLEDVDLMVRLGIGAYRFSLSWPRIQPTGRGPVNPLGIGFYDQLVDALLANGITPWITLYHWDLPYELELAGGWPQRDTAARFADFARLAAGRLGDRVSHWITLNEPFCSSFTAYAQGGHAPGRREPAAAIAAAHHLLLGHGLATAALRDEAPGAEVGVTLNLYPTYPADDSAGAHDAARRIDGLCNRFFLDPVLRGRYPEDVVHDLTGVSELEFVEPGDLSTICAPIEFLGVNYYTHHRVTTGPFPGSAGVTFVDSGRPTTAMGWEVVSAGLTDILTRVTRDYGPIPLYVTESGAAYDDVVGADGCINDVERRDYLIEHLAACREAITQGAPLAGYFVWSLLDNFEWAEGYAKRFGIVHVDYATQERRLKASGEWYASFLGGRPTEILGA